MRGVAACLLVLLWAVAAVAQPATLTGSILGADGLPLPIAHVHAIPAGGSDVVATVSSDAEGRFALDAAPGAYTIRFTGAYHRAFEAPFLLEAGVTVVTVRLTGTPVFTTPEEVRLHVYAGRSRPLYPQADGTFAVTIRAEADTVAYQLSRAFKDGKGSHGTDWNRLVWDGAEGYTSILDAPEDSLTITFDPRLFPEASRDSGLHFAEPGSRASRVTAVLADLENRSERVYQARRRALGATRDEPADDRAAALAEALAPFGLPGEDARLAKAINAEQDAVVRQALLLSYLSVETEPKAKDTALALRALEELGSVSGLWSLHPDLVQRALDIASPADSAATAAVAQQILAHHPDATVRAYVLLDRLDVVDRAGDVAASQALFLELQGEDYAETDPGLIAAALFEHYDTRGGIHVGADAPDFEVHTVDGGEVTRTSLLGTVYLLDFWATWCAPCIREMPTLHDAYDRFHARGFEIVSVSFDETAEEVKAFRDRRFPMPWPNAHVGPDFGNDIARAFEVGSLPRPLLVGADGRIAARDHALRGANLERTLESILGAE